MNTSTESVSDFAARNYDKYKDAFAEYLSLEFLALTEMDHANRLSRSRVSDIATGRTGYQIERPQELLEASDEKLARLEDEMKQVSHAEDSHIAAGAAHYKQHAAEYHALAVDEATQAGVRINQ